MNTQNLVGKEKLEASEIENRIATGIALYRAKLISEREYERLRTSLKINKVKAYRFRIVAQFVALENEGLFKEEYILRTHWSTLVALASKPEEVEEHRMILHMIHYGMLREDQGLPVSQYCIPSDSTTPLYILKYKDSNYIRAMYANCLHEAGVALDAEQRVWLTWPCEPLVIEKSSKKTLADIASNIAEEIEESFNFETEETTYPVNMDLSYVEPGRESAVLNLFTSQQQNGDVTEDIKTIIQEQLQNYFGITAPDAEEMRKIQQENQELRECLYDVLMEIRTINNTVKEASVASSMFIEATENLNLQIMRDKIADMLNKG